MQCGSCNQHSIECVYEGSDLRKARHTTLEFEALTSRITFLEQQVRTLSASGAVEKNTGWSDAILGGYSAQETGRWLDEQIPGLSCPQIDSLSAQNNSGSHESGQPETWPWFTLDSASWELEEDFVLAPREQSQASQALDELTTIFARLQVDRKSGGTFFVGPTSNLHLRRSSRRGPDEAPALPDAHVELTQSQRLTSREQFLLGIYSRAVHPNFPVLERIESAAHTQEREWKQHLSPLLLNIVLAVAAFFADDSVPPEEKGFCSSRIYLDKFTSLLGHELNQHSLANVKAFLLRAYLAILEGRLESATIFNSKQKNNSVENGLSWY